MKKVLAVASGGGHWVQLLRLRPAFSGTALQYLTTNSEYGADVSERLHVVTDANIWEKAKLVRMFAEVFWILLRTRPHVIVTTGAAPGFAAVLLGRLLGAKTVWIDSIANSEDVSNSGRYARRWATAWVTQWEHLSGDNGPDYWGSVL